nr:MAG TPA: hypothetical protein [Caudoviricetes sp.]
MWTTNERISSNSIAQGPRFGGGPFVIHAPPKISRRA